MMVIFLQLLAAHYVGDFLLQTDGVYALKKQSFWGVFLHAAIVFIATAFFMSNYTLNGQRLYFLGMVFFTHSMIDYSKIIIAKTWVTHDCLLFWIDQLVHVSILCIISVNWNDTM